MNTLNYSAGCDWAWGGDWAGKHGGGAGSGIPRAPPPPIVSCSVRSQFSRDVNGRRVGGGQRGLVLMEAECLQD